MNSDNLSKLEVNIGYKFNDIGLLKHALTHSSYINEHKMEKIQCNERLEFLGDAVLEMVSSEFLYKEYPDMPEGNMSKFRASLVCEPALAFDARQISLQDYIILGKGEEMTGGRYRDSIVSDACEAVIGAIFLDGGIESAKKFVLEHILNDAENKKLFYDSKSILQEMVQSDNSPAPVYRIVGELGPAHCKTFLAEVLVNGTVYGEGSGRTKKQAEQNASYQAILKIKAVGKLCI
jgi:ribonuclease-3